MNTIARSVPSRLLISLMRWPGDAMARSARSKAFQRSKQTYHDNPALASWCWRAKPAGELPGQLLAPPGGHVRDVGLGDLEHAGHVDAAMGHGHNA
jgi:hypothetical protein